MSRLCLNCGLILDCSSLTRTNITSFKLLFCRFEIFKISAPLATVTIRSLQSGTGDEVVSFIFPAHSLNYLNRNVGLVQTFIVLDKLTKLLVNLCEEANRTYHFSWYKLNRPPQKLAILDKANLMCIYHCFRQLLSWPL